MRVAIVGLFNSGSSVLSQIMETLGFEIGAPLWGNSYESRLLRAQLIDWWREPRRGTSPEVEYLCESVPPEHRVPFLRWWAEYHETKNPLICAKHPLLCLSAFDLVQAWGSDLRVIRASRPLEDSIAGLQRRDWYPNPIGVQMALHYASERFFASHKHHVVEYRNLVNDPEIEIGRIVDYLQLSRTAAQIKVAASLVQKH